MRISEGWSQEQAAAALSTTRNQYAKLEAGTRRLSTVWIDRAAQAFRVDAGDIVRGNPSHEIVGTIEAEGRVRWSETEPPIGAAALALAIVGDGLGPLCIGGQVEFQHTRQAIIEAPPSGLYVVAMAEQVLVRRVVAARRKACVHLLAQTGSPELDVSVMWLSPVTSITFDLKAERTRG